MKRSQIKRAAFRTISQIGIQYGESTLSKTLGNVPESAPHAGDRFPWLRLRFQVQGPREDLFQRLDDNRFNLFVIGQPAPSSMSLQFGDMLQRATLQSFDWRTLQLAHKLEPGLRTVYLTVQRPSMTTVPDDGRIKRDIERIGAAIALRDAYLDFLAKKGARLAIEHDGKKINAPVAKVENGEVVFAENKQGVKSLPLRALDPLEIAKLAEKKETQGNAPAWTRAWIHLLAGDAKWEKLFKVDSDAARDLREDGNVWYRDRLRTGLVACP